MTIRRRNLILGASLVSILSLALLQIASCDLVRTRIETGLAQTEGGGSVGAVRVCLPCGSYVLESFEILDAEKTHVAFSAERVVVSIRFSRLWRFELLGEVLFEDPLMTIRAKPESESDEEAKRGSLNVPIRRIGDALSPLPLDRIRVTNGRIELRNDELDPAIQWTVDSVTLEGTSLAADSARSQVEVTGRPPRNGHLDLQLVQYPDSAQFELEAELRDVSIVELNAVLRHALGVDAEKGLADVDLSVRGDANGDVIGSGEIRVRSLDLLAFSDLSSPHPGLLLEGLGDLFMRRDPDGGRAIDLQIEIDEAFSRARLDPWSTLGTLLYDSVFTLVTHPFRAVEWVSKRIVSSGSSDN